MIENTHRIMPYKKNYFILYNFLSTVTLQLLFHFSGGRRLFLFNGVLFTKKNSKLTILTCIDEGPPYQFFPCNF